MRLQRCLVALMGLLILFGCAVMLYISEENRTSRELVRNTRECNTVIPVASIDYANLENTKRVQKRQIKPKKYFYRNASRQLLLTKADYEALVRIVEAEATGGSIKSKKMVANVVLNRVADSHFPSTVTEVVFQRGKNGVAQFSPITDGRFQTIEVTKETKKAVKQVLAGEDESAGALFFVNPQTASARNLSWFQNHLTHLFDCGGHAFYCYKS